MARTEQSNSARTSFVGGAHPDFMTMTMLHCLFAVAFAAVALGLLAHLGAVTASSSLCPACPGYTRCAMWQDLRSLLSFVAGALMCCCVTSGKQARPPPWSAENTDKVQLYAYML